MISYAKLPHGSKSRVPTERQRWIHGYMLAWQRDHHGIPPTMRQIMAATGIASTNAVSDCYRALERRGMVVRVGTRHGVYVAV